MRRADRHTAQPPPTDLTSRCVSLYRRQLTDGPASTRSPARAAVARESRTATRQLPAQGASGASRALARILPSRPWHSAKPRGSHHPSPTSGPRKLSTGPRQRNIGTHAPHPGPDCRRTASRDLVRWNPFSDGLLSVLPTNDAPQKLADTAMCLYGMVRGRRPLTTHTGRPPCSYQPHRVSQPPRIDGQSRVATGLPRQPRGARAAPAGRRARMELHIDAIHVAAPWSRPGR